jgi:hypothetical protein
MTLKWMALIFGNPESFLLKIEGLFKGQRADLNLDLEQEKRLQSQTVQEADPKA